MISAKSQSQARPTALGTLVQASTYGATIPVTIGMTRGAPLLIWAANLRQGACAFGKKGKLKNKKAKKGKGLPQYVENVDFLLGHNPIFGILRTYINGTAEPLNFVKVSASPGAGEGAVLSTYTISDAKFYFLVGVTLSVFFGATQFNDYGGPEGGFLSPAATTVIEVPLWNSCYQGPDPADSAAFKRTGWAYRWRPDFGATVYFEVMGDAGWGSLDPPYCNFYYAQIPSSRSHSPIAQACLSFESQLGDGSEYTGSLSSQQIIYPEYAGAGSPNFSLGAGAVLPSVGLEKAGSFMTYPTGDADFADMIEYALKSGQIQAGLALEADDIITGKAIAQQGLGCNATTAIAQKKYFDTVGVVSTPPPITLDLPVTAGNWLVATFFENGNGSLSIADSLGNTWTQDANLSPDGVHRFAAWHCKVAASGLITITITSANQGIGSFWEIQANDTLDGPVLLTGTVPTNPWAALDAQCSAKQPEFLLAIGTASYSTVSPTDETIWRDEAGGFIPEPSSLYALVTNYTPLYGPLLAQSRTVRWPGAAVWRAASNGLSGTPWATLMYGFRNSQASAYPEPLGDILDYPTLKWSRVAARAGGLWGAIEMNSQRKAGDWMKDFYYSMNAWPVWSGFRLKSIPRSEVSVVANGATYSAYTAAGPVANLSDTNGDFVSDGNSPPITVKRKAQTDAYNILQIQHVDRNSNYNPVVTSQPDPASIALLGVRKAAPEVHNEIQDPLIARKLLAIAIGRETRLRNSYEFTVQPRFAQLEPGDLITIEDDDAGIFAIPVRIQSTEEQQDFSIKMTAEPFIYGLHDPTPVTTASSPQANSTDTEYTPANVNAPVIFEPVPRLYQNNNERELWIAVSDSDTQYGGCAVMLSTDGGATYNQVGLIMGSAITGDSTADWPAAASPDTTNDLPLDLTESNGVLPDFATSDEDNVVFPCYIAGGTADIPYELMTYGTAQLTATSKYTLKATGSGNHLDRAVYGAPNPGGAGVDHPSGSRFCALPPSGQGILKLTMDDTWIGVTLHFKFLAFNEFGGGEQSLASATDYTYTPTGTVGSVNPGGAPPQLFAVN